MGRGVDVWFLFGHFKPQMSPHFTTRRPTRVAHIGLISQYRPTSITQFLQSQSCMRYMGHTSFNTNLQYSISSFALKVYNIKISATVGFSYDLINQAYRPSDGRPTGSRLYFWTTLYASISHQWVDPFRPVLVLDFNLTILN